MSFLEGEVCSTRLNSISDTIMTHNLKIQNKKEKLIFTALQGSFPFSFWISTGAEHTEPFNNLVNNWLK